MIAVHEAVQSKLSRFLAPADVQSLVEELARETCMTEGVSPEARLAVGDALTRRGGILALAGRAISAQAILHGAQR